MKKPKTVQILIEETEKGFRVQTDDGRHRGTYATLEEAEKRKEQCEFYISIARGKHPPRKPPRKRTRR